MLNIARNGAAPEGAEPVNQFAGWRRLLEGEDVERSIDHPLSGYYRIRHRDKATGISTFRAVAYWYENGKLCCLIDSKEVDDLRAREQWAWASKNPIEYQTYLDVTERGKPWPDVDGAVHEQSNGRGHNNPPTDPAEILKEQIESASAGASAYAKIEDDETAKQAQTLRSRLLELSGQADKHREALKRPHLEAGRAIDGKWQPIVNGAKAVADNIRGALGIWETVKLGRERQAALIAAENARRLQEVANRAGVRVPEFAPPPPPAAPIVKGGYGRAASVKVVKVVREVNDWSALFAFLKDDPELRECAIKLAKRRINAGQTVPGVVIAEERRVT